jgi:hypothetical protein
MSFRNRVARGAVVCLFALGVTLTASSSAMAAVLYDFTLAANGDVGPVNIVLRFDDFVDAGSFFAPETTAPAVREVSTTVPIQPSSQIGLDVIAAATRFGIALFNLDGSDLLFTVNHPDDFFVFERTPTEIGTFQSTDGLVVSSSNLDSRSPVATLTVTEVVPEPATVVLLGMAAMGAVARARKRRR